MRFTSSSTLTGTACRLAGRQRLARHADSRTGPLLDSGATKFDNAKIRGVIADRLGPEVGQLADEMDFLPIDECVAGRPARIHACRSLTRGPCRPLTSQPGRLREGRRRIPTWLRAHPGLGPHYRLALLCRDRQAQEGRRLRGRFAAAERSFSRIFEPLALPTVDLHMSNLFTGHGFHSLGPARLEQITKRMSIGHGPVPARAQGKQRERTRDCMIETMEKGT